MPAIQVLSHNRILRVPKKGSLMDALHMERLYLDAVDLGTTRAAFGSGNSTAETGILIKLGSCFPCWGWSGYDTTPGELYLLQKIHRLWVEHPTHV